MAAATVLGVSACATSEVERGYKIPEALCDTPVSPGLLERVLPAAGETISMTPKNDVSGIKRCRVTVDGKLALSASTEWWGKETTLLKVASTMRGVKLDDQVTEDRRFAYAERGAVGRVECPNPTVASRKTEGALYATIWITDEGAPNEAAMKDLITAYTAAVTASAECIGGE